MPNRLPLTPDQLAAYQAGQPEKTAADSVALTHEITRALGNVGLPLETTLDRMSDSTPTPADEFIVMPESFRDRLTNTYQATEKLFARIGLTTPSIGDVMMLARAGTDPTMSLMSKYNSMRQEGKQPELVLSPRLRASEWRDVYTALTADASIPNNPLKERNDGHGLWINSEVETAWGSLDIVSEGVLVINYWTLRVIPGTPQPTQVNIDHNGNYKDSSGQEAKLQGVAHPTVNEYLTLQAVRIQSGQDPIDASTWSWLDGTFGNNNSRAPAGRWFPGVGRVYVRYLVVGRRRDCLGVRVPVWGE